MHRGVDRCRRRVRHPFEQGDRVVDVETFVDDQRLAVHAFGEGGQQRDGVVDDLLSPRLDAVHEPAGEFELGVESGALARVDVGGALAAGDVGRVDVVGGRRRRREPLQIGRRIAHREPVPVEHAGHGRHALDVLEEERGGAGSAENDRRVEAPQRVGGDRQSPAFEQRLGETASGLGAIDHPRRIVPDLLRRAHGEALGAHDRERKTVQRGQSRTDRRRRTAAGRQLIGVDAVAGQEVDHEGAAVAEGGLAEQLRSAEGQQSAHAGGEGAQRACLGGELGCVAGIDGGAHDDLASVFELGDGCVEAACRPLGEGADAHDADPRQSRRHRRG
ncbi:hypothetical protein GCM10022200_08180 [Microbacterium awajiense]|uniref:Uncharacterized protein n=1 Tax=Microbacterium awajiense TaxID=415214 RepID=A0ABP7AA65_9MICO